jgi:arginyl-tRNA synthetase
MVCTNPFAEFRLQCESVLEGALKKAFPQLHVERISLEMPPSLDFGQLASSLCFELAKEVGENAPVLAERLVEAIDESRVPLVKHVVPAGGGYINFHVDFAKFSALTLDSIRHFDTEYGFVKTDNPSKIIVEHTSVNPIHPIHIGHARNPILGDALARILRANGHTVFTHYYVDDVGRQSAVIAYGYEKLGKPKTKEKPDHLIGRIYTVTSCITEIQRLKKELEKAREASVVTEEISKLQRELDDWMSVAAELKSQFPQLFNQLLDEINKDADPESRVIHLNRAYEAGDEETKRLVREVCELCLEGFKTTLGKAGVFFNSWDWESDLVWSNAVGQALEELQKTPYVFRVGGVSEFDAESVAQNLGLKRTLGMREDHAIPSLTLVRTDGTTLYPTRDIAYSLWKLKKAERVINVVGAEQKLSQLQLKLALCALSHIDYAERLTHFAYNLVTLPGYRMESRTGRYITFDEVMDEAAKRAYQEVSKRSPHLSEEEKQKIASFVGIGAVRYALVEVDPSKPVVFTWDRVLNFEKNSAPYIQYSHARACSIIRKAGRKPEKPDHSLLKEGLEYEIVLALSNFPEVFIKAAELLKPNLIADFANALADKFNTFYNALPVIKAEPQELSDARLALVDATRIVLRNCLNLIGLVAPERM